VAGAATRRTLLRTSLAGLGVVALTGCGRQRRRIRVPPGAVPSDVALLNAALAIEQRSIAAYTAAAPLLGGFGEKVAGQFLSQELLHAGELRKLIKDVGGQPHNPRPHYDFGHPRGRAQLLALLHDLERAQIGAYLHALPRVSTPALRQSLASIMANDAQHVTVLRAEQGMPALTGPFITATQ
jgi:bacterioferritin (cytochrome b1)